MAFYSQNFVFDGHPGESLGGLLISSQGAEASTDSGSNVELITQQIYRKPRLYLLGVQQSPVLSFDISFNAQEKIDAIMATKIEATLFGQMAYKKLQVIGSDYTDYYWNCFLTSPQIKRVGGEIVGWDATVTCDSPWAYSFPRTLTYNYTPPISNVDLMFNNRSGNNDYMYPKIIFTMKNTGGSFTIKNNSDGGRLFTFSSLAANEVITVDNNLQIITSSLGLLRLANFNKKWQRFVKGRNDLKISGNVTQLKIVYQDAQKIGG